MDFHGGLIINEVSGKNSSVRRGDIIVKIGDVPIYDFKDLRRALSGKFYGDSVTGLVIFVVRRGDSIQLYKRIINLKVY